MIQNGACVASLMLLSTAALATGRTADDKPIQPAANVRRPNVTFILTDDQGSVDVTGTATSRDRATIQ